MALSDERIWGSDAIMKANAAAWLPIPILRILCHSVEAEVRKDDEALIWQLVEAVETGRKCALVGGATHEKITLMFDAEKAARARLDGKP